ncbi:MAG TPA: class I SAM-dependent methyltransferase, partial [Bradyrhizobium sp.]|nr:class I SAM-dependent methyltransferase [Bradyrhizobium sp.]
MKSFKQRLDRDEISGQQHHWREIDGLLGQLLWAQLRDLHFPQRSAGVAEVKAALGVQDLYGQWLEETLRVLTARGYLDRNGESYSVVDGAAPAAEVVWRDWDARKAAWLTRPTVAAQVALVEKTLRSLPGILAGATPATEVLFPNASLELVEAIYKDNPIANYFNETVAELVVHFIEARLKQDASSRIRILEVGAGTGGTSAQVFAKLKPYQDHVEEYCYTDLSRAFLMRGEDAYREQNPYLRTCIFDIEKPIAGQGVRAGSYDLVIAANVLHATRHICHTLRNVKAAMRRNGLLLLTEISSNSLFYHLTFGLLEGWWLYEDHALRVPGCPALSPEAWRRVLEAEGFRSVFFPAEEAHEFGQQVIIGESDGVVRQEMARSD